MKKITFWLLALFMCWQVNAQLVSTYSFSQSSGTYTPITGGTVLGTATNDDNVFNANSIGFTFNYNGTDYTQFSVNANGFIALGGTVVSSYTAISSGTSNNVIAALNGDLQGNTTTGELSYILSGTAPNQVLTIQWKSYRHYNVAGDDVNFQIKLYETSNVIEVVYGSFLQNATARTRQVGLRGASNADYNNRTTTTDWNATTAGTNNAANCALTTAIIPASGLTFAWTPPPPCTGIPVAGSVTPATFSLLPGQASGALTLTGFSLVSGLTFQWEESLDGGTTWGNAVGGTGATTISYTPPVFAGAQIMYRVNVTCTASASSAVSSATVLNPCGANAVPTLEPLATFLPTCWQEADNGDLTAGPAAFLTGAWVVDGFANSGTTGAARILIDGAVDNDWVLSPLYTIPATGYELKFDAAATQSGGTGVPTTAWEADDFVEVLVSTGTTNWIVLHTFNDTNVPSNIGEPIIIDLDTYAGLDVRFAFRAFEGTANGAAAIDFSIDNFEIRETPACLEPTNLTASNVSDTSIDLSWVAGGTELDWQYLIQPQGTGTPTGSESGIVDVTSSNETDSTLSPNTAYEVYVRSFCSVSEQSPWVGPVNFTTQCATVTDFVQNFDGVTATAMPACWAKVGTTGTVNTQTTSPNSAPNTMYIYGTSGTNMAVVKMQPVSNLGAGTHRIRFSMRANFTVGGVIEFGYLTNPADASTFVALGTTTAASLTYQQYTIAPVAGTYSNYPAFRHIGVPANSILIDDVNWEPIPAVAPTCVAITSPANGATGVMSSTITWGNSVDATGYNISVGTTPGGTEVLNSFDVGNVLTYNLSSAPGTTYYVTVYPYNAFGTATGCTEISFTTCGALTPDILEPFTTFLPSCWVAADNGDLVAGPATFGTSGWVADGFGNVGTTGAIRYEIWLAAANDWIISPVVNIPATGYELKFDAAATQWNTTAASTNPWEADDYVEVLVSTTGMNNWTVLYTYNNTNVPATTGTTNIIDLDAYAGQSVRFAYRVFEGTANGTTDLNFYVDNFEVRLTPASAPLCATNFVNTPNATCGNFDNLISWDASAGANGYYLTVGTTSGGTDILNNVNIGSVLSYTFPSTINTTYFYTVVPYNGVGPATGCAEQSFSSVATGCYCTSVPTSNDASGITNVQIATTNFPTTDVTYFDHTATVVDLSQGINSNLQVTFATGYAYNTFVSIDFNDDFDFNDAGELVYSGVSASANPTTLNASFMMPGTAPLGQHRMRINTGDASFLTASNPCYSGAYGVTLDFTINIVAASCTPPAATTAVVPACGSGQFSVDVTVTALGNGTPSITDGTTTWPVTALGVVNVGPFTSGSSVTLTLLHGVDGTCDVPLGSSTYTCPAANDDLCNAIPVTVNATSTGTAYGNVGATSQTSEPVPGCFSDNINGSVWFTFVAPASGEVNITTDIAGATLTDTEIAVYAATGVTCSDLTTLGAALGCDQDGGTTIIYNSFLNLAGLTPGATYYIQVDDYGFGTTKGTFGLEVAEVLASDSFDNNSFVAYPNPVKDVFNVSYTSEISSVRVMNLLGQEVLSRDVNATSTQIDMSQLSTGAYIVNVTVGDTIKTIKVVKQ
ncbi:T9SS type A sorting domain-containing protein [Flavobacterium celericrescens]|uniref:T9SS type A sorting domain-containing protein n=1 Tax=Flavobacterium celericrescens TaxID=2709780 RepID=A0ABX0IB61_9FLAO|nr:T9SS type A sorting domain-containing protein [Flavobacterium celericrescens]NHM03821.1 T9SS type A sorting domain-containing protein [Flavobacterium celericrescens]